MSAGVDPLGEHVATLPAGLDVVDWTNQPPCAGCSEPLRCGHPRGECPGWAGLDWTDQP